MIHLLKQRLTYMVPFMVVIFGMTHGIARGEDIALANLPDIIRKASDKAVPNAKWNKVVKDTDGKDTWYDISGIDAGSKNLCNS